jgi:SAM-dependent methyltransferase
MTGMNPDFGRTTSDYSTHRQGFPDSLYELLAGLGARFSGARAVDLGTGTGTLARGMARRGASATGIDLSSAMTAEAARLDMEWGVSTQYLNTSAEKTGLESAAFDLVTAGQSWWWFDNSAALAEVQRILRPGGILAICSFDWVPAPGNVVELTERLITQHNPRWSMGGGTGRHPEFLADLKKGGFEDIKDAFQPVDAVYTRAAWRGRVRASAGIGASLDKQAVHAFDLELASALDAFSDQDPILVPHALYLAIGRKSHG